MRENQAALEKLDAEYALLQQLNTQRPYPGFESTVDNVAAAKKQRAEIMAFIGGVADESSSVFRPVDPIPSGRNLDNAMFANALRKTIDQLQTDAARNGVRLPTNFNFSFTAERDRLQFEDAGLRPLAEQLGDVRAICGVLIRARVNALDSVRRPRVSVHDIEAKQLTDYLPENITTNKIALIAPYEVSFRCFSAELGAVLSGYASSPNGLIVRAMNVEPAVAAAAAHGYPGMETPGGFVPGMPARPEDEPRPGAYPARPPFAGTQPPVAPRGALPKILDEKQIKVTMLVQVVKLQMAKLTSNQ
jgi:hypothetical protein